MTARTTKVGFCEVLLLSSDKRLPCAKRDRAMLLDISNQTAEKVHESICRHFAILSKNDKELFKVMFREPSRSLYDCFEFATPTASCSVFFYGERKGLISAGTEKLQPFPNTQQIVVSIDGRLDSRKYSLSSDDILLDRRGVDPAVVSLANSAFSRYFEHRPTLMSRAIVKAKVAAALTSKL